MVTLSVLTWCTEMCVADIYVHVAHDQELRAGTVSHVYRRTRGLSVICTEELEDCQSCVQKN
jgi:hypothetical protein